MADERYTPLTTQKLAPLKSSSRRLERDAEQRRSSSDNINPLVQEGNRPYGCLAGILRILCLPCYYFCCWSGSLDTSGGRQLLDSSSKVDSSVQTSSDLSPLSPPLLEDDFGREEGPELPGSNFQKAIAMSLQAQGLGATPTEPECVICLDLFDRTNPRIPTLCQCGIWRVNFHHSCLLEWIAQRGEATCPSCDTTLFYEEPEAEEEEIILHRATGCHAEMQSPKPAML